MIMRGSSEKILEGEIFGNFVKCQTLEGWVFGVVRDPLADACRGGSELWQAFLASFGEHQDQAFDGIQAFWVRDLPQGLSDAAALFQ